MVDVCLRRLQLALRAPGRCTVLGPLWLAAARADVLGACLDPRLLASDFVYVPVHARAHWAGAIVCRCAEARYRVLVVDSLGDRSPIKPRAHCELIIAVLAAAWHTERRGPLPCFEWAAVRDVPAQPNETDCALYMLVCFARHSEQLPPLHLQPGAPRWDGALAFTHATVAAMRAELCAELQGPLARK